MYHWLAAIEKDLFLRAMLLDKNLDGYTDNPLTLLHRLYLIFSQMITILRNMGERDGNGPERPSSIPNLVSLYQFIAGEVNKSMLELREPDFESIAYDRYFMRGCLETTAALLNERLDLEREFLCCLVSSLIAAPVVFTMT